MKRAFTTAMWVTCPVSMTAFYLGSKTVATAAKGARSLSRALRTVTTNTTDLDEAASGHSTLAKKTVQAEGTGIIYELPDWVGPQLSNADSQMFPDAQQPWVNLQEQSLTGFKKPKKVHKQVEVACLLYTLGGEPRYRIDILAIPACVVPFSFVWLSTIRLDFNGASKDATSLQRTAIVQSFAQAAHKADLQLLRSHTPCTAALPSATARVTRQLISYGKTTAVHVHQELQGLLPHPSAAVSMQWTFADLLQDVQDRFELLQDRLARKRNIVAALKQQLAASKSKCESTLADNIAEAAADQAREGRVTTQLREAEAACQESEAARQVLKGQLATAHHQGGVFQSEQLEAATKLQQQAAEMEQQKQQTAALQQQVQQLQGRLASRSNNFAALKQQLAASESRCQVMSADNIAESAAAQARERRVTTQLREAEAACQESEAARRVLEDQLVNALHTGRAIESEQWETAAKVEQQAGEMEQQKQMILRLQTHLRARGQQYQQLRQQLYTKHPQVAAVVEDRYERQIAALSAQVAAAQKALSAQVAAAQKEASMQQELFTNARRQIASLHERLGDAQKALDDERTQANTKLQRALDEKNQMHTRLHDMLRQVEAQLAEVTKLRQQESVAKRPACALSEVLKKEVAVVLLHARTLSAKDRKDFIMKLRLKFHPDKNQYLTTFTQEIYKALQSGLD